MCAQPEFMRLLPYAKKYGQDLGSRGQPYASATGNAEVPIQLSHVEGAQLLLSPNHLVSQDGGPGGVSTVLD